MTTAVRICRDIHAPTAFTGDGAKRYGGRWNSPGRPVVYLAGSAALAILEIAVHTDADGLALPFVVMDVQFSPQLVTSLNTADLPADWFHRVDQSVTRTLGDRWLADRSSLLLKVPSAVVPREFNYLLNPLHDRIGDIKIGKPLPIRIDTRIKR